ASARRLFLRDDGLRKKQALFVWQCQVLRSAEFDADSLAFLTDPISQTANALAESRDNFYGISSSDGKDVVGSSSSAASTSTVVGMNNTSASGNGPSIRQLYCFEQYFLNRLHVNEADFTHVVTVLENSSLDGQVRKAAVA
ncbi:unnamed protein product, partial [Amoebophrya sp. A25]